MAALTRWYWRVCRVATTRPCAAWSLALGLVVVSAVTSSRRRHARGASTTTSPSQRPTLDTATAERLVRSGELGAFDAIVVLGGGPPVAPRRVMPFVAARCDAAKRLFEAQGGRGRVLTVSAGTAHAPQLLTADGLPIWESTAAAAYLLDAGLPPESLVVETTSYDTIGNAFFARIAHADLLEWRRVCVVTTDWHMERSRAIFEWVFNAPRDDDARVVEATTSSKRRRRHRSTASAYELVFVETPSVGLSAEAVAARTAREQTSLGSVRKLAVAYPTLRDVHAFLTTKHDLYTASKLAAAAFSAASSESTSSSSSTPDVAAAGAAAKKVQDQALLESYGGGHTQAT